MALSNFSALSLPGEHNQYAHIARQELTSAGGGDWFLVPRGVDFLAAILVVNPSSSGYIEVSNSPIADLENNTADAVTWDLGIVSSTSSSLVIPVLAIRAMEVKAT